MNIKQGLCNGTRLIIKNLKPYVIQAEIITGSFTGKIVLLPRIDLSPDTDEIPFYMNRRQFPIRLAFAMTINKAQGQSFDSVGLYLPTQVFSHGQLYVALSRSTSKKNIKILVNENAKYILKETKDKQSDLYLKNIVYKEIL